MQKYPLFKGLPSNVPFFTQLCTIFLQNLINAKNSAKSEKINEKIKKN